MRKCKGLTKWSFLTVWAVVLTVTFCYAKNEEETMITTSQNLSGTQLARSLLLFFGAFMFAFILNSYIIHEAGHAFGGMLFG